MEPRMVRVRTACVKCATVLQADCSCCAKPYFHCPRFFFFILLGTGVHEVWCLMCGAPWACHEGGALMRDSRSQIGCEQAGNMFVYVFKFRGYNPIWAMAAEW
jgi:hypothetical protein